MVTCASAGWLDIFCLLNRICPRLCCCTRFLLCRDFSDLYPYHVETTCRTHWGELTQNKHIDYSNCHVLRVPSCARLYWKSVDILKNSFYISIVIILSCGFLSVWIVLQSFDFVVWLWPLARSEWSSCGRNQNYTDRYMVTGEIVHLSVVTFSFFFLNI